MNSHEKLNYIEFPSRDLAATKAFFEGAFDWTFVDYGPEYTAFANQGLDGGFYTCDLASSPQRGASLLIFYSDALEATLKKVEQYGGEIVKAIYCFPGGRRFHFCEPCGNEFAVWGQPVD